MSTTQVEERNPPWIVPFSLERDYLFHDFKYGSLLRLHNPPLLNIVCTEMHLSEALTWTVAPTAVLIADPIITRPEPPYRLLWAAVLSYIGCGGICIALFDPRNIGEYRIRTFFSSAGLPWGPGRQSLGNLEINPFATGHTLASILPHRLCDSWTVSITNVASGHRWYDFDTFDPQSAVAIAYLGRAGGRLGYVSCWESGDHWNAIIIAMCGLY
ncbi:hypothetical protein N7490_003156 [Penicillium lividum]|nr:hypothetical protein N7490_003156 [Penicillium lividum]